MVRDVNTDSTRMTVKPARINRVLLLLLLLYLSITPCPENQTLSTVLPVGRGLIEILFHVKQNLGIINVAPLAIAKKNRYRLSSVPGTVFFRA